MFQKSQRELKELGSLHKELLTKLEVIQYLVISFTRNKDVSAEVVRYWDGEARKLFDELGWSNYDENLNGVMLELEIDTSWWKE